MSGQGLHMGGVGTPSSRGIAAPQEVQSRPVPADFSSENSLNTLASGIVHSPFENTDLMSQHEQAFAAPMHTEGLKDQFQTLFQAPGIAGEQLGVHFASPRTSERSSQPKKGEVFNGEQFKRNKQLAETRRHIPESSTRASHESLPSASQQEAQATRAAHNFDSKALERAQYLQSQIAGMRKAKKASETTGSRNLVAQPITKKDGTVFTLLRKAFSNVLGEKKRVEAIHLYNLRQQQKAKQAKQGGLEGGKERASIALDATHREVPHEFSLGE